MATLDHTRTKRLEGRSLAMSMWGNLFMAVVGLIASLLSNSNAIMMDGLFSLIGFGAAFLARRISQRADTGPDKLRPFGYAADEAIFSTFRALSLIGLVLFAIASAAKNIYAYLTGAAPEPLHFTPMFVYFSVVGITCVALWAFHYVTWWRTGKRSPMLRLEAKAAMFDSLITAAAGGGMAAIYFYRDGPLAPIAPIGDSLIVLLLCVAAVGIYIREFRGSLAELAGATAAPKEVAAARRALRSAVADDGGVVRDISVTKLGRNHFVTVYYDPARHVSAAEIDRLTLRMIKDAREVLPESDVFLVITEHTRRWPAGLSPF